MQEMITIMKNFCWRVRMSEEEIRNHLYDVYAGEDWDFLTNYIMKLQQENRQLKEMQCPFLGTGCKRRRQQLESVLDEIREYIKYNATSNYFDADTNMFRREVDILQILDKVK